MNELILRFPTLEDKDKFIEYYNQYLDDNANSDPLNYSKYKSYEEFLIEIGKEECLIKSTTKTIPTSSYLLVENNEIIGHIFIHHLIDLEVLREYEGHIGYGIRPSKRNQGYGTRMLSLALEKCKDLCLKEVFLSCKKENISSARIIEKNNGILLGETYIAEENSVFKKYKIVL